MPGPAAGADEQHVLGVLARAVAGDQLAEGARLLVVVGIARQGLGAADLRLVAAGFGGHDQRGGFLLAAKAGAAEHDDGVFDAHRLLLQVGLEQLQLEADAAGFAAQQELGVGECQPAGIGVQRQPRFGMGLQCRPGVGKASIMNVSGGSHRAILGPIGRVLRYPCAIRILWRDYGGRADLDLSRSARGAHGRSLRSPDHRRHADQEDVDQRPCAHQ